MIRNFLKDFNIFISKALFKTYKTPRVSMVCGTLEITNYIHSEDPEAWGPLLAIFCRFRAVYVSHCRSLLCIFFIEWIVHGEFIVPITS